MALLWIIIDLWISGKEWNDMGNNCSNNKKHQNRSQKPSRNNSNGKQPIIVADPGKGFINPYNFVPLGDGVKRKDYGEERIDHPLTGVINCTIELKTPTIIPGNDHAEGDHKIYAPLVIKKGNHDEPYIPGSDLRGMIRSAFEEFSNSCLSGASNDLIFDGRSQNYFKRAAVYSVEDNKLYKADIIKIKQNDRIRVGQSKDNKRACLLHNQALKIGDPIYIDKSGIRNNKVRGIEVQPIDKKKDYQKGYISIGEIFNAENGTRNDLEGHLKVFIIDENIIEADNISDIKQAIIYEVKNKYREKKVNTKYQNGHSGYASLDLKNLKMIPLYYEKIDNKIYVSLASRGRVVYDNKLKDLLNVTGKEEESYMPCHDSTALCPACHLFGTVDESITVASHIRITDASLTQSDNSNYYENQITLAPLSSPKYSNAEFYLYNKLEKKMADKAFYTVDFYKNSKNDKLFKPGEITIRGRKEYWHFEPSLENFKKDKLNATFTPLKKGLQFSFKVYFDHISETELNQMITTLSLEGDENQCFKLGHGKPLGFGSVKIHVQDTCIRCFEKETADYTLQEYDHDIMKYEDAFGIDSSYYKAIRIIHDFHYLDNLPQGIKVSYPIGNNGSYEWFVNNKKYQSNTSNKTEKIHRTLPFATDALELSKEKNGDSTEGTLILPIYK